VVQGVGDSDRLAEWVVSDARRMIQRIGHGEEVAIGRIICESRTLIERVGDPRHAVERRLVLEQGRGSAADRAPSSHCRRDRTCISSGGSADRGLLRSDWWQNRASSSCVGPAHRPPARLILAIESMGAVAGWPATTDTWPGAADSDVQGQFRAQ
jgi:hypothetical protein